MGRYTGVIKSRGTDYGFTVSQVGHTYMRGEDLCAT